MSSPVSFTLMGRNDIFLSNLRSSVEKNSVSDLGSEFGEFRACKMRQRDQNQILRHSKMELKLNVLYCSVFTYQLSEFPAP